MEVETTSHDSDFEGAHGPCVSCLYEDELDNWGLCGNCNPIDPRFRVVLLDLLRPMEQQV